MRFFVVYFIFAGCALQIYGVCNDANKQLYTEMGCKPTLDAEGCPLHYNCDHLWARSLEKCYHRNLTYDVGSQLPQGEKLGVCIAAEVCHKTYGKRASWVYANVECPELFGPPPKKPSYYKHTLDICCGEFYTPSAEEKVRECTFEGRTAKEGQLFYPQGNVWGRCVCTKEFDGTAKSAYCKTLDCGYPVHYYEQILNNGFPFYIKDHIDGCVIDFKTEMPSINHVYLPAAPVLYVPSPNEESIIMPPKTVAKCKYLDKEANWGDSLIFHEDCSKCWCITPPLLTCNYDEVCNKTTTLP